MEYASLEELNPQEGLAQELLYELSSVLPKGKRPDAGQRGLLNGFAHGVKPAITLPKTDLGRLQAICSPYGLDTFLVNDFLVNRDVLEERRAREPEFAQELGWAEDMSAEAFVAGASLSGTAEEQERAGFVVGYPQSAIRAYSRREALKAKGLPSWNHLLIVAKNKMLWERFGVERWNREDQVLVETLGDENWQSFVRFAENCKMVGYEKAFEKHQADLDGLRQRYFGWIRELYARHFQATDEERDFLLEERAVAVCDPDGDPVYEFVTLGKGSQNAPDVLELKRIVNDAFTL